MKLFTAIVALGLGAIVAINRSVDVAGLDTFDLVTDLANRQGPDELVVWDHLFDQRAWLKAKLVAPGGCPALLILGSSTVGALRQDMFGTRRILNGWLSAPSIEDFEALTNVLRQARCRPEAIVLGVDHWLVNAAFTDQRWLSLFDDYVAYHEHGGSFRFVLEAGRRWNLFKEQLNFATTRATVEYLWRSRGETITSRPALVRMSPDALCATISTASFIRANDGHYVSCASFLPSQDEVDAIARNYVNNNGHEIRNWKEVDPDRIRRLEQVVRAWNAQGVRVVVLAPAFHPLVYAAFRADAPIRKRLDALDRALAALERQGIAIFVNARDPASIGCLATDFEDSHHGRPECSRNTAVRLATVLR